MLRIHPDEMAVYLLSVQSLRADPVLVLGELHGSTTSAVLIVVAVLELS
jgi:hypothetical protein